MKENLIAVARISAAHGVRGEVKLLPLTDFPHRFESTESLLLADGTKLVLEAARVQRDMVLAKFRGMDTPEVWKEYRHKELYVTEDNLMPLPEGQYYIYQMTGLAVFDEQGNALGELTDVLQTGSNDVYAIKLLDGKELLVPAIESFVKQIDMNARKMIVVVPEYW